jgi:Tfp pilus assembly protein PilE
MTKGIASVIALLVAVVAAAVSFMAYQSWRTNVAPALSTPYHAVLLQNGQAFFGRIQGLDPEYVVLQDVYYIQSRQHPETKQVANVLVKRGQEWHSPDRMILNKRQVILLEPVTETSQVAKLIAEQSSKGAPPPAQK